MAINYQDALVTSLYGQLFEEAVANECIALCPGMQGSFTKENRRDSFFWYWAGRDAEGKVKRVYIGPDDEKTGELIEKLKNRKEMAEQAIASMRKTTSAFLAAGGRANEPSHFRLIALLAQQQLFRKGVLIVGSHGFTSICNALGIGIEASQMRTTDIDFARPRGIALAIPDEREFVADIPAIVKEFDRNFFLVPELNPMDPSTSLLNNRSKVKIDFLTVNRDGKSDAPVFFKDIGIAAAPLRFMNYLLGGRPLKGLVIGQYAICAHFPDPSRFAVHKLIVSQARQPHLRHKSKKDIVQAAVLLEYFVQENPILLIEALNACQPIEGSVRNIQKSLPGLSIINADLSGFIENVLSA